jgi:ribA/ribD-fused uncharacterized protein
MAKVIPKLPMDTPAWAQQFYQGITDQVIHVQQSVSELSSKLDTISVTCAEQFTRITSLEKRNTALETRISQLEALNTDIQNKLLYQESYSRRQNLLFHGFPEQTWETEAQCEIQIRDYLRSIQDTDNKHVKFDKVHRIGQRKKSMNKPRPIIARFNDITDRQAVWKARPRIDTGSNKSVMITQDFPKEIQRRRRQLMPILKAAKSLDPYKENSYIFDDKLVINNKTYTVNTLSALPRDLDPRLLATLHKDDITFFWSQNSPLSNHYACNFTIDGIRFNCNEQYYMYHKATFGADAESARDILAATDPVTQLNIAKRVTIPNYTAWEDNSLKVMETGLTAKFEQNEVLREFLHSTGDTELVEASPRDMFWGIGVPITSPTITDKSTWKGKNHLGKILMKIRSTIT